jgi:hypothetical protein
MERSRCRAEAALTCTVCRVLLHSTRHTVFDVIQFYLVINRFIAAIVSSQLTARSYSYVA